MLQVRTFVLAVPVSWNVLHHLWILHAFLFISLPWLLFKDCNAWKVPALTSLLFLPYFIPWYLSLPFILYVLLFYLDYWLHTRISASWESSVHLFSAVSPVLEQCLVHGKQSIYLWSKCSGALKNIMLEEHQPFAINSISTSLRDSNWDSWALGAAKVTFLTCVTLQALFLIHLLSKSWAPWRVNALFFPQLTHSHGSLGCLLVNDPSEYLLQPNNSF